MRLVRRKPTLTHMAMAAGAMLLAAVTAPRMVATSAAAAGAQAAPAKSQLAHGEYLVRTGGCHDCHTPWKVGDNGPEPDLTKGLMGHPADLVVKAPAGLKEPWIGGASATMTAWSGPWGRSYSANLTSDKETGIGAWTEKQFIDTIRTGKHHGTGRSILPPMPILAFRNLADDDLAAIFAFLKTVPAIRNKVPAPVPPSGPAMPEPPLPSIQTVKTAPGHADPVARGKYLVTAKGCGDCHTPMKMGAKGPEYDLTHSLAGFDARGAVPPMPPVDGQGEVFALEPAFAGAWGMSFAANLTPDVETGLGSWTEQQFLDTLRNGRHQGRGRQLLPPMPWPVFGQMTDEDLKAVFAYLKTVTPIKNKVPDPLPPAPMASAPNAR